MNQDRQHYFADMDEEIAYIVRHGMRQYVATLIDFGRVFTGSDRVIRCVDEGTPEGILHRIGSGYNFGIRNSVKFAKRSRATAFSWHRICGGVRIHVAGEEGVDPGELTDERVDEEARKFCEDAAKESGLPCIEETLIRPDDQHIARCLFYDGTGQFDQTLIDGLPNGFAISRAFEDEDKAKWQAEAVCGIAFDHHHGFGELLTADKPFLLIAIGKSSDHARELETELAEVVASFVEGHPEMESRLKVDSFEMQS